MGKIELTLLSEGQIWGNEKEEQLEALKKYGTDAAITDLAILTGADIADYFHIAEDNTLAGRTGKIWTDSYSNEYIISTKDNYIVVSNSSYRNFSSSYKRYNVIRPVIKSLEIFDQLSPNRREGYNGIYEVEFGEYPQDAVSSSMQKDLEIEYINKKLQKTGNTYTFDSVRYDDYDKGFSPITYEEYEYEDRKFIRVIANIGPACRLSNNCCYNDKDAVWVEVKPVKWLIDEKTKTLVSKKGLISGIRFLDRNTKYKGDFENTDMYKYLDRYMSKELFQNVNLNNLKEENKQMLINQKNLLEKINILKQKVENGEKVELTEQDNSYTFKLLNQFIQ